MARRFILTTIAPPESPLTPEVAGRWMREVFPYLSSLGALARHRDRLSRSPARAEAISPKVPPQAPGPPRARHPHPLGVLG